MWLLIFVVLTPVAGIDTNHLLEKYSTKSKCESEKLRVLYEMSKAYPDDPTWTLECRFHPTGV